MLSTIGHRLKAIRKIKGLTQSQVCYGICDRSLLSHIEQGRVLPSLDVLEHLAMRLGLFVSDIVMQAEKNEESEAILDDLETMIADENALEAVRYAKGALRLNHIRQSPDYLANCLLFLGRAYYKLNRIEEAMENVTNANRISENASAQTQLKCMNAYSAMLINTGFYEPALTILMKANNLSKIVYTNQQTSIRIAYNIANVAKKLGYIPVARRYSREGLMLAKRTGYHECSGHFETINGLILLQQKDFMTAKTAFERALRFYEFMNDTDGIIGTAINMAEIELELQRLEQAELCIERVRDMVSQERLTSPSIWNTFIEIEQRISHIRLDLHI